MPSAKRDLQNGFRFYNQQQAEVGEYFLDSVYVDFTSIIRELGFLAGAEAAREEIKRGEGMDPREAKQKLRE